MKKVISVVLALVMMMAVMVPAFAATLDVNTQSGNSTVLVDGITDKGDGTYSVEIPASVDLIWGDTTKAGEYKITSQVQTDKRVKVTLAKAKDLTNAANETIEFAVADATTGIANSAVVNNEAHTFNLTIDASEWAAASIATYEGTITFTAELADA
ncbi:MAG: hypothetical protein IJA43_04730 [Clostridia bacterium]|nr:hypothetical protein [Clostridia bacterium]